MSDRDLTRWNRAGLARFRYIDGNAVTHLERLRLRLADAYTTPGETLPRWSDLVTRRPEAPDESAPDRAERLAAQYGDPRRDHAWEILRSFARSSHVLTEHIDAFANETFIGTATQWESLRRLLAMLDARPAPPASAQTQLAIDAKAAGVLAAGFQVRNAPADGSAPAIFETRAPLSVDPELNLLRAADWNRSQEPFSYQADTVGHFASFPLANPEVRPVTGEIAVIEIAAADGVAAPVAFGVKVVQAMARHVACLGQPTEDGADLTVKRWRVALRAGARQIMTPRLAGPDVVRLTPEHNLSAGRSAVTWSDGGWQTARVLGVDGDRVRLSGGAVPPEGTAIYLMQSAKSQTVAGADRVILPQGRGAGGKVWNAALADRSGFVLDQTETGADDADFVAYQYTTVEDVLLYVPGAAAPVATVIETAPTGLVLGGTVSALGPEGWIVSVGSVLQAVRVVSVTAQGDDTVVETMPQVTDLKAPLHFEFADVFRPFEHDLNRTAAFDVSAPSDRSTRLFLAPGNWPDALRPGRAVVVETAERAHACAVTSLDRATGVLEVAPPLPGTELTQPQDLPLPERWDTRVSANVVAAGHGETQPRKILGSGDATQSSQTFEAPFQDLAFVADPLMPAGVRADLAVTVGARTWRQVGNLRGSGPTGTDYEVAVDEDGTVRLRFGNGRTGSRLPTGTDNVGVHWRKGVGTAGNLAAGGLVKIVRPDPAVAAVRQPVASSGGAATEGVASLRETAATGLLTLGRAVSVADFGKLAARNAQVLQALAVRTRGLHARGEAVSVIVVPSGGRMGTLGADLTTFLQSGALPGVTVGVQPYVPLPLSLNMTLRVDRTAYDPSAVSDAVRAAILADYALEAARLGASLFRSQLLHLAERTEGVATAVVEILTDGWSATVPPPRVTRGPGASVRSVHPRPEQMIHHDPGLSDITILTEDPS